MLGSGRWALETTSRSFCVVKTSQKPTPPRTKKKKNTQVKTSVGQKVSKLKYRVYPVVGLGVRRAVDQLYRSRVETKWAKNQEGKKQEQNVGPMAEGHKNCGRRICIEFSIQLARHTKIRGYKNATESAETPAWIK